VCCYLGVRPLLARGQHAADAGAVPGVVARELGGDGLAGLGRVGLGVLVALGGHGGHEGLELLLLLAHDLHEEGRAIDHLRHRHELLAGLAGCENREENK
jgi:hypothetical protein